MLRTFMAPPWRRATYAVAALCPGESERLFVGTQVDFLRPGRLRLPVEVPVCLGDAFDAEQPVLATLGDDFRAVRLEALAIDPAVDHDVGDVQALGAVFARHALRKHAQSGLGGGEMREARLAAQAAG